MVTLDAIHSKIARLQKQAAEIAEKQASVGLVRIRDLMARYELSIADIERFIGKRRGRKPSAAAGKSAARAAGPVGAPVYADPKTGATWTGRGRAPTWIKDVKDRTKFLIEGAAGDKSKGATAKKAPVKRAAAKRSGAKSAKTSAPAGGARATRKAAPAAVKKAATRRQPAARKTAVVERAATPEVVAE